MRDDATAPHQAASWATAVDGGSKTTKSPGCDSPYWAMLDGGQLKGWWGMVLPWTHSSVHPAHNRQQLLERNHAVTEPGGEFHLEKTLKAKGQ